MSELLLVPAHTLATTLHVTLLGSPQVRVHGQSVPLARRQMRALLYRLASAAQPVAREHLCFLLWPDVPEAIARRHLTVLLNRLRDALPVPGVLLAQHDAILLDPAMVEVDTVLFARAVAHASTEQSLVELSSVIERYEGPFLDGFTLPASPEFDAWVDGERHVWERRYLDALALLVDGYAAQNAYGQAVAAAQRALAVDVLAEDMHRRLIELYATMGDRAEALRRFERCVVILERELGVSPLPETRAVYEDVRDGRLPMHKPRNHFPGAFATPGATSPEPPTKRLQKLPAAPAPLLGRDRERTHASTLLLDSTVRLLTLIGPGGSGKTRFAQQIGWDVTDSFADGVVFVPLAALRDPALVVQAIASMCELTQTSNAALGEFLHDKHILPTRPAADVPARPFVLDASPIVQDRACTAGYFASFRARRLKSRLVLAKSACASYPIMLKCISRQASDFAVALFLSRQSCAAFCLYATMRFKILVTGRKQP